MTSLFLAVSLSFTPVDAKLAYDSAAQLVENCTPRDSGTFGSCRAANFILDKVSSLGADARVDSFKADTPKGVRNFFNVESDFISHPDNDWIVFVSHFDTKEGVDCPGANDGASTTGLLIALAGKLFTDKPKHTNIRLLWTDGEECINHYSGNDGLWGSKHAAKKLKESGVKVRAVVCFDMLGDKDLRITIPENVHPGFKKGILRIAERKNVSSKIVSCDDIVTDDHVPFLEAGFKTMNFIDFDFGSKSGLNDYWHTSEDTIDKISEESLLFAGRLATWIIEGLDK